MFLNNQKLLQRLLNVDTAFNTDIDIPQQVMNWINSFTKKMNTNWIINHKNSNPQMYLYPK